MKMLSRLLAVTVLCATAACGGSLPGSVSTGGAPAGKPGGAIGHVFIIVLENKSFGRAFGEDGASPYLSKVLPSMGLLMREYYGTGHASLDNYITMVSGQPPNVLTQADCPLFVDVLPGIPDPLAGHGVLIGQGCVYPKGTLTIADQLEAAHYSWKGYMQDMGDDVDRDTTATCAHPKMNTADGTESAAVNDQYATRHNPFMYFHSIIDEQESCDRNVVNLRVLEQDLKSAATTPNYSFITPDLCADGHDGSCADGGPGGFDGIDAFLREWVPKITGSPAFQQDGFLLITFDESDDNPDDGNDACCDEPTGPNTTAPGAANINPDLTGLLTYAGGGRIGAVVVSPFVKPGSATDVPYNHYSMLRSVENMFGLEHLGYAGQGGLAPFGEDVYNNGVIPTGTGS